MLRQRLLFGLAMGIFLLLQFSDCIVPTALNPKTMRCCAAMPCTPANRAYGCCKTTKSAYEEHFQPAVKASLQSTAAVGVVRISELDFSSSPSTSARPRDTNEHAPPVDLYSLYHSLLI